MTTKVQSEFIGDAAVTTAKLADDAVTADKLANSINTSIAAKLPLAGGTMTGDLTTNGDIIIDNSSGDPFLKLKTSAQEYVIRIDQSDSEKFQIRDVTDSATRITLDGTGKVGIGTDSPTTLTELRGTIPTLTLSSSESKTWAVGDDIAKISFFSRDGSGIGAHETGFILNESENSGASLSGALVFGVADYNTAAAEAMRIDSDGKVGIGTAAAADTQLHVKNTGGIELRLEADSNNNGQEDCFVRFYTDGKTQEGIAGMDNNNSSTLFSGNTENAMVFGTVSNLPVVFATNNTERMQITNDGSVGIGGAPGATFDVNNTTASDNRTVAIFEGQGNGGSQATGGQYVSITRTGPISSTNANVCGGLLLANGSSVTSANCGIRGTYEYNNGRDLQFFTSGDNSTAPSNRMVIKGNGNVGIGSNGLETQGTNYLLSAYGSVVTCWFENRSTTAGHEVMILNRKESHGTMVAFLYNDAEKGTITQSGGAISYNAFMGSHYTETSENQSTILIGTVMETVDALVENKYEDQKRLVKCKVSDTSESTNVYGVWFDDNETGQVAGLGASFCRINNGVTVSMGDLLVSNGDGTAKVQSDDIIRSKTIGKVTSTVKKETYSDGSYVVPVVLYCG